MIASASVDGSGMTERTEIVPLFRVLMGMFAPVGSLRLVVGNGANETVIGPDGALAETSKSRCPRPNSAPAPTVVPRPVAAKSEAISDWPVDVLIVGPNDELPWKM